MTTLHPSAGPAGARPLPMLGARRWGRIATPGAFSVVDVETTGLDPDVDRVIELAVVTVDATGSRVDEWSTLVDPGRDAGPTDVHGITDADLVGTGAFTTLAAELGRRLDGTVLVAHNLPFDAAFLRAEEARLPAGIGARPVSRGLEAGLCTLELSRSLLSRPAEGWNLGALCASVGVPLIGAHRALADARATAGLLGVLLAQLPKGRPRLLRRRLTIVH